MVGVVQRDKALRMLGGLKDAGRVIDANGGVTRPVEDEQRLAKISDSRLQLVPLDVIQKLLLDAERTADQQHFGLALGFDLGPRVLEVSDHVG